MTTLELPELIERYNIGEYDIKPHYNRDKYIALYRHYLSIYRDYLAKIQEINKENDQVKKLSLFHIYDGYLSNEYGSYIDLPVNMRHAINSVTKSKHDLRFMAPARDQEIKTEVSYEKFKPSDPIIYGNIVCELMDYIDNNIMTPMYIYFGPKGHATSLYIVKTADMIIIHYINTGEGINEHDYLISDPSYHDSIKKLYFSRSNIGLYKEFVHYLKPFLLFRYVDIDNATYYRFYMNLFFIHFKNVYIKAIGVKLTDPRIDSYYNYNNNRPYERENYKETYKMDDFVKMVAYKNNPLHTLEDHYFYFYNNIVRIYDKTIYYNLLHNLFKKQDEINKVSVGLEEKIKIYEAVQYQKYVAFYDKWLVYYADNLLNPLNPLNYEQNYINKAISTFQFKPANNKLYFELQRSGTCVYKSSMVTWLLHWLNNNDADIVVKYYDSFTKALYNILNYTFDNITTETINNSVFNSALILNRLTEDKILSEEYTFEETVKFKSVIIQEMKAKAREQEILQPVTVLSIPQDNLDTIIRTMRDDTEKKDREKLAQVINNIYEILKNTPQWTYTQPLRQEYITLGLLYEYYYNYDKARKELDFDELEAEGMFKNIHNTSYFLFNSHNIRFTPTHDEIMWLNQIDVRYNYRLGRKNEKSKNEKVLFNGYINIIRLFTIFQNGQIIKPLEEIKHYQDKYEKLLYMYHDNNIIDPAHKYEKKDVYSANYFEDVIFNKNCSGIFKFINKHIIKTQHDSFNNNNINTDKYHYEYMVPYILDVFRSYIKTPHDFSDEILQEYVIIFVNFFQYFPIRERYKIVKYIVSDFYNKYSDDFLIPKYGKLYYPFFALLNSLANNYVFEEDNYRNIKERDRMVNNHRVLHIDTNNFKNNMVIIKGRYWASNLNNILKHAYLLFTENEEIPDFDIIKEIYTRVETRVEIENITKLTHPDIKVNPDDKTINYHFNGTSYTTKVYELNIVNVDPYGLEGLSQNLLLLYLINNTNNISLYDETNKHIIMIINKDNYGQPENLLFIFKLENDMIDYNNININGSNYIYTNDYNTYPFLINAPKLSLNFVHYNERTNKYKFISILNTTSNNGWLTGAVVKTPPEVKKFIEFNIKPNMLTPYYDENNTGYLEQFRKEKVCEKIYKHIDANKDDLKKCIEGGTLVEYQYIPLDFTKLEGLYNMALGTFEDCIYLLLTGTQLTHEVDFTEWMKQYIDFTTKDDKGIIKCIDTKCDNAKSGIAVLKKLIEGLKSLRDRIIKRIDYKHRTIKSVLQFIHHNHHILSLLLQTNTLIDNIIRAVDIFENCNPLSCYDIMELAEQFKTRSEDIEYIPSMVEIIFGRVLRQEQIDKFDEIMGYYTNKTRKVHQFMMAKGKSSLITPLLYYVLSCFDQKVYIVVPSHLKKQTEMTYYNYKLYFGMTPDIMTDSELKLLYLDKPSSAEPSGQKYDKKGIYLFDEFDSMYNPLQSNFNIINEQHRIMTNMVINVFDIVTNYQQNPSIQPNNNLEDDIYKILSSDQYIRNVTYGMSNVNKNSRICIPYNRQDSPNEGSDFSSYILGMVLSAIYFYKNDGYYLDDIDIDYITRNSHTLLRIIALYINKGINIKLMDKATLGKTLKTHTPIKLDSDTFKKYYILICRNINISTKIRNCAFIDIMSMDCVWQVGYSGTVNINMAVPIAGDHLKYDPIIVPDKDEYGVEYAMKQNSSILNLSDDPIKILAAIKDKDVVIDACGVFKDLENVQVAKILSENNNNRNVIYLTKEDEKRIFINGKSFKLSYELTKGAMYYFSQRHTVGIDIENQPTSLTGIVIINKDNTYTQVAQAMFRMRKLNKGQTCMFGYIGNNITNSEDIYKMLQSNEDKYNKNYEPLLYLQYLKYYTRQDKINQGKELFNVHKETKLGLLFEDIKTYPPTESTLRGACMDKISDFTGTDEIIGQLREYLETIPLLSLVKTLYQTDTTVVNKQTQQQTQQQQQQQEEQQQQQQTQRIVNADTAINLSNDIIQYVSTFFPNPLMKLPYLYHINPPIQNNNYTIIFSYNIINHHKLSVNNSIKGPQSGTNIILVLLADKTILIETGLMIGQYINIYPVYNLSGKLINHLGFKDVPKQIPIDNILNFNINIDEDPRMKNILDFSYLFDIVNDTINTINIIDSNKFIYGLLFVFITFALKTDRTFTYGLKQILQGSITTYSNISPHILYEKYNTYIKSYYTYMNTNVSMLSTNYEILPEEKDYDFTKYTNHLYESRKR